MSIDEFAVVAKGRIPTPQEFVDLTEGLGWSFVVKGDGAAALKAPQGDRLAIALARMLGRQPYRTNVLALLGSRPQDNKPAERAPDRKRRVVLLDAVGSVESVLEYPDPVDHHNTLVRLAEERPGRMLAAEWRDGNRWRRFMTMLAPPALAVLEDEE